MPSKPVVLMEAWWLIRLNDQPHQLSGYATDHPHLPGFRRFISTSRVLRIDEEQRRAETLNTVYLLRHPIKRLTFDGAYPIRLQMADLIGEREDVDHSWYVRRGMAVLADGLISMSVATLTILAILDREESGGPPS